MARRNSTVAAAMRFDGLPDGHHRDAQEIAARPSTSLRAWPSMAPRGNRQGAGPMCRVPVWLWRADPHQVPATCSGPESRCTFGERAELAPR